MVSGGLQVKLFQRVKVNSPLSRKNVASLPIAGCEPLYGASGSFLRVLAQVDHAEEADVAALEHRHVLLLQPVHLAAHHRAELRGVLHQLLVDGHAQHGLGRGQAHRVRVVGQAAPVHVLLEVLVDGLLHAHRAEREVRGGQALGHGDQVGHHVEVLVGHHLAGAADARHHLVADEQDAVLVEQRAQALEPALGRHEHAVGAGDRLDDHRRDVLAAFVLDGLFEVGEVVLAALFVGGRRS